jgi:hypothetical protein
MLALLEIWLKTHFLLKRLEALQVCNYKKTVFNLAKHFFCHVFIPPIPPPQTIPAGADT